MTSKRLLPPSARLALATIVATGMVAAPVALTTTFGLTPNVAQAEMTPATTPSSSTTAAQQTSAPKPAAPKPIALKARPVHPKVPPMVWSANGELLGYRFPWDQNLVALTRKPINDMTQLSLNKVLSTRDLVPVNKFTVAAVDEQEMATDPMPADPVAKNGSAQSMTGSSATMDKHGTIASLAQPGSRHAAELRRYAQAMTNGDLDVATTALAQSTDVPITEQLVLQMNRDLGVSSSLDAQKVAQVAADKQQIRLAESEPVSY